MRNNPNGKYYLANDIVFDKYDFISHGDYYNNGRHFISMGTFSGVFDGCGHTITGLIGDNGIAVQNNGTIKNVVIDDSYLTDAAICKVNYGVVENCKLSNSSATNGIVTNNGSKGTIRYCFSETSNTGICNFNAGTIDSCINNSDITEDGFYYFYYASIAAVGGITCVNIGSIKNCINNGNISSNLSDNRTAGIAGTNEIDYESGTVESCMNTGNISGKLNASGITNNGGSIYDSINTGSINMLSKKYYGSYSSTITTPTSPSKVKAKSATIYWHHDSRKYSIKWNKVKNVSGYQIQVYGYDYNKNKKYWKTIKTVKGAGKTSYTSRWYNDDFDGEKIRIRAYKEVNGKKYYGEWTVPKAKWSSK